MLLIKNDRSTRAMAARVGSLQARVWQSMNRNVWLHKNDGKASPAFAGRDAYGLVGTSSMYKR